VTGLTPSIPGPPAAGGTKGRKSKIPAVAGGGVATNGSYQSHMTIGQGDLVATMGNSSVIAHPGFLKAFLLHPTLDTDGEGLADENDPDDDNDSLEERVEITGTSFSPAHSTDPLDPDSDAEGQTDGNEAQTRTNPNDYAMSNTRIAVFGVSPSGAVTFRGKSAALAGGDFTGLAVIGDFAYVTDNGNNKLQRFDASTPASISALPPPRQPDPLRIESPSPAITRM